MKKIIYIIAATALSFTHLTSCNYLEVDEMGIVSSDEMFTNINGFESAMNGAYSSISANELYGKTLTYGFLEEISFVYNNILSENYKYVLAHDYKSQFVRPTVDGVWSSAYKSISYLNNILANVDNGVLKNEAYGLIKAEALGLRAYLHFDILRLFAKRYIGNENEAGIPYQTEFSTDIPDSHTIKETCELIIKDLIEAEKLAPKIGDMIAEGEEDVTISISPEYVKEQRIHFNAYAIKALMARVYLYMGNEELAAAKAKEVIDSEKFTFTNKLNLANNTSYPNGSEAIFGVYKKDLYSGIYDMLINNANSGNAINAIRKVGVDINQLYEKVTFTDTHNDYRLDAYFFKKDSGEDDENDATGDLLLKRFGNSTYDPSEDSNVKDVTLIQIPEMYYIYAEAMFDTNPSGATNILNDILTARGLREIAAPTSKQEMIDILFNERYKEYFGTGALFFENKRLNRDMTDFDGNTVSASDNLYTFPLPEAELDYGGGM